MAFLALYDLTEVEKIFLEIRYWISEYSTEAVQFPVPSSFFNGFQI